MSREVDVVIIGGGIVGCATAYHLARRGSKVALFDKGELNHEASSRNWGYVRQGGRSPLEMRIAAAAIDYWSELQNEHHLDLGFVQAGQVVPIESAEDLAIFEQKLEIGRSYGLRSEIISAGELRKLVPALGGPWIAAVYSRLDGLGEPSRATKALALAAKEHGAEIYTNCAVERIGVAGGCVRYVSTELGEVRAAKVVCAAGVWSSRIARMIGFNLPTKIVRITVGATQACPPVTQLGIWSPYVACRQLANGQFILGNGYRTLGYAGSTYRADRRDGLGQPGPVIADYDVTLDSFRNPRLWLLPYLKNRRALNVHVGKDLIADVLRTVFSGNGRGGYFSKLRRVEPMPNNRQVAYRLKHFCEVFPALQGIEIARSWAGYIDWTPDSTAVLGELEKPKGFILAGPLCGHGFGTGPLIGRLLTELILDGNPSLDIHALRPSRFREGYVEEPAHIL